MSAEAGAVSPKLTDSDEAAARNARAISISPGVPEALSEADCSPPFRPGKP